MDLNVLGTGDKKLLIFCLLSLIVDYQWYWSSLSNICANFLFLICVSYLFSYLFPTLDCFLFCFSGEKKKKKKSGAWYTIIWEFAVIHSHFINYFSAGSLNSYWSCRQYVLQKLLSPLSSFLHWLERINSSSSWEVVPFCPKVVLSRAGAATAAALQMTWSLIGDRRWLLPSPSFMVLLIAQKPWTKLPSAPMSKQRWFTEAGRAAASSSWDTPAFTFI